MSNTRLLIQSRAAQQPDWTRWDDLDRVLGELAGRPALVSEETTAALREELAFVARGTAFVIQSGDCAELFSDSTPQRIRAKASALHALGDLFESLTKIPVVRVGRLAGQYAKPRSSPWELLPDGTRVPVYRGDAVNGAEATMSARQPDPRRLLRAYELARRALTELRTPPHSGSVTAVLAPTYTSHEALLLEYEHALLRDDARGGRYASSAPFLWIGERTRQPDHAHIDLAAAVSNPVGVKVGPDASPAEVTALLDRLNPGNEPGRLTLIVRMGAERIGTALPALLGGLGPRAAEAIWMTDPMHGNTRVTAAGQKSRVLTEILAEVETFFSVTRAHGLHAGGLHLESAPDDVTECVARAADLAVGTPLPRYESGCDPRLNPAQAEEVVRLAASLAVGGAA